VRGNGRRTRCGVRQCSQRPEVDFHVLERPLLDTATSITGGLDTVALVGGLDTLAGHTSLGAVKDWGGFGARGPSSPVPVLRECVSMILLPR
jgi:hypothetical protein